MLQVNLYHLHIIISCIYSSFLIQSVGYIKTVGSIVRTLSFSHVNVGQAVCSCKKKCKDSSLTISKFMV